MVNILILHSLIVGRHLPWIIGRLTGSIKTSKLSCVCMYVCVCVCACVCVCVYICPCVCVCE